VSIIAELISQLQPEQLQVGFEKVEVEPESEFEESELDERWSYVGKKTNPRWLWDAIDQKGAIFEQRSSREERII
jgi:insertion element IS1 protein InsB